MFSITTKNQLEELSRNLWWSWHPEALSLFMRLNRDAFTASGNNPLVALKLAKRDVLNDVQLQADVDTVYRQFKDYMESPGGQEATPKTAYFCMEYGLHESLPLYSGGLGILAGDHTKAASDVGLPLTAVGLFLRDGYFRQYFDDKGGQHDDYPAIDSTQHPVELATDKDGKQITVTVHFEHREIHLRAWKVEVGKTILYLLDTDFSANPFDIRFLTRRLYQGDRSTRIQQEIILGIGGIRFLKALGESFDVYHMNEGHCAFLTFELMRERMSQGESRQEAESRVRESCVFTTHTPVIAGHDRFEAGLFNYAMRHYRESFGISEYDFLAYGRVNPDDANEEFTMTVLGLKLSRKANGVSKLHGVVARHQWNHLFPHLAPEDVPISHITNGIHIPTWASPTSRSFLDVHLGTWEKDRERQTTWDRIDQVSDRAIWEYRNRLRAGLISFVNDHIRTQTMQQDARLDREALTIGFARRFATYKRAPLLFSDLDRITKLFKQTDRPIQVIYAGKAHPHDDGGKAFIQQIYELSHLPDFNGRLIFLENYNMEIGRKLISGCDVWLNNPRRPMEASGTSGQKVAVHGGLNLSILDGWWPEGFDGTNGWSIGDDSSHEYEDPAIQDPRDAELLYEKLENEVIPLFYQRSASGRPDQWIQMVRSAMKGLTYQFSAHRMIKDYIRQVYTK